jgi:hypothetical protein
MRTDGLEILESLRTLGVTVRLVEPDKLRFEPASKIPAEMLPRIREEKSAILEVVRSRPTTCVTSCYEIEPSRRIHRPWNGCATIQPEMGDPLRKVQEKCWHCRGEKRCDCIACWHAGPSECVVCKGTGQVWRWVQ